MINVQVLFADLQQEIVVRSKTNPPEALSRSAGVLAKLTKQILLASRPSQCCF
jgi:hypothetical protein